MLWFLFAGWVLLAVVPVYGGSLSTARPPPGSLVKNDQQQLVLRFGNGTQRRYDTVDNPRRGSPVYYIYQDYLPALAAHRLEVWRIGKQTLLLPARSGVEVMVGTQFWVSPQRSQIFSSDCRETNCYLQVNDWPSGRQVFLLEHTGSRSTADTELLQNPIPGASVRWRSEQELAFDMPCVEPGSGLVARPAVLRKKAARWQLIPSEPCRRR